MRHTTRVVSGLVLIIAITTGLIGCGGGSGEIAPAPLTLLRSTPAAGATNVPLNTTIQLTFSQPLANDSTISVLRAGVAIAGLVAINGATLEFTPAGPLSSDTVYTVNFAGVRSLNNLPPTGTVTFSFTTGAAPPPQNPVQLDIRGAQWVAFQDGKNGSWSTLSANGGFSGTVNLTAADNRYSVAYVCGGQRPTVNIVHATRDELPQLEATCGAPPTTFTLSGAVRGLSGGQALIAVGEAVAVSTGNYTLPGVATGSYDVIAVRLTGGTPDRVWLHRNRTFNSATQYNINFNQADGSIVRVFDVSSGAISVAGIDTNANESVSGQVFFLSGGRASLLAVGTTLQNVPFMRYPIIPSSVLNAGEAFRVQLVSSEGRGVEQTLANLPANLSYTLPPPYLTPSFTASATGAVTVSVTTLSYAESPVRAYLMQLGGNAQLARYRIVVSAAWLGNDSSYTSPVLTGLAGWNANWSLQRGALLEASWQALVSPSPFSIVWATQQGANSPIGFELRYATRRQALNL